MEIIKPKSKEVLETSIIKTILGEMFAVSSKKGIIMLDFYDEEKNSKRLNKLKILFDAEIKTNNNKYFLQVRKELSEYFDKKRKVFDIKLDLVGTNFQKKVWQALLRIPYGKTISYKELAKSINKPSAYRAVANANGKNLIPILIPCHRVINTNGKIGGYSGGIDKKEFLINLEIK